MMLPQFSLKTIGCMIVKSHFREIPQKKKNSIANETSTKLGLKRHIRKSQKQLSQKFYSVVIYSLNTFHTNIYTALSCKKLIWPLETMISKLQLFKNMENSLILKHFGSCRNVHRHTHTYTHKHTHKSTKITGNSDPKTFFTPVSNTTKNVMKTSRQVSQHFMMCCKVA